MKVMALFSTSFFAKCLRVGEDGPGRGHLCHTDTFLVLYKSIAGRYRPVRTADGPITARYRFIKNASWDMHQRFNSVHWFFIFP